MIDISLKSEVFKLIMTRKSFWGNLVLLGCVNLCVCQSSKYKLWKCCPENEFFDLTTKSCTSSDTINLEEYRIDPGILDYSADYSDNTGDQYEEENTLEKRGVLEDEDYETETNFEFLGTQFPNCSDSKEFFYLYNHVSSLYGITVFTILPKEGHLYLTLTDDSLVYQNFCVDRAFKNISISSTAIKAGFGELFSDSQDFQFQGTVVAFCRPKEVLDCARRPCLQSCCAYDEVFDPLSGICDDPQTYSSDIVWKPELYNSVSGELMTNDDLINYWNINDTKVGSNFPIRIFYKRLLDCTSLVYDDFKMFQDGSVSAGGGMFNYSSYCVRNVEMVTSNSSAQFKKEVQVCTPENPEDRGYLKWVNDVDLTVIPALLLVSLFFFCMLFIHTWLTSRSKLFGAMMLSTVATLTLFYVFLTVVKFSGAQLVRSHPKTCTTLGFLIQFTNMASFFWLNAMSFDIWMRFRSLQMSDSARRVSVFQREPPLGCMRPQYKWYALYAWGIPLTIVFITVAIQFTHDNSTKSIILPFVGERHCFFGRDISTVLYLYVITAPVLTSNIFFFLSFVYNLCCGLWANKTSTNLLAQNRHKSHLKTVIKIFFVMGITWIADIVSFVLGWLYGQRLIYKYVIFFNIVNALQGFTMFCVLFFNTERIKKIKKWFAEKRASTTPSNTSTPGSRLPTFTAFAGLESGHHPSGMTKPAQETFELKNSNAKD